MELLWDKVKKSVFNIFKLIIITLLSIILVINVYIMIQAKTNPNKVPSLFGYKPFVVLSGSMDKAGTPYPGFVFRINRTTDEYELEANSTKSREVDKFYTLEAKNVVIKRVNGILYLKLGDNEEEIIDYSTLSRNFYYPLTIGASLDKEFKDWRYFYGTISNLSITLFE